MANKYTVDEITDALECCSIWHNCNSCTFFDCGEGKCVDNLMHEALGFINKCRGVEEIGGQT